MYRGIRPVIQPQVKLVEYATKEELKEEVILAQNARSKMTTKI